MTNPYREIGGAKQDRTADLLRARQALSQLSYGPKVLSTSGMHSLIFQLKDAFVSSKSIGANVIFSNQGM